MLNVLIKIFAVSHTERERTQVAQFIGAKLAQYIPNV